MGKVAGAVAPSSASVSGLNRTCAASGKAPFGTSRKRLPVLIRPPSGPTTPTTLPSSLVSRNPSSGTVVVAPEGPVMEMARRSFIPAGTVAVKPPSGSTCTWLICPVARLMM